MANVSQRFDEAEKAFVKALQLDPSYKDSEDELVKLRMEQMNVSSNYGEKKIRQFELLEQRCLHVFENTLCYMTSLRHLS